MAPDTKREVFKFWLAISTVVVGAITWLVKLESKVSESDRANVRQDVEIRKMVEDRRQDRETIVRVEENLKNVADVVREIRDTIRHQNYGPKQ